MLRLGIVTLTITMLAMAEGFAFTIGSPVAAQDFNFKAAAFVFRTEGCADPTKSQISATAEGFVKGVRRSIVLKVVPAAKPGIYAVQQSWPAEGQWVVNLKGTCANLSADAIVTMGPKGFIRESSKFFSRPATDSEIETSLAALPQGGNK